jgi:hypothetical protein
MEVKPEEWTLESGSTILASRTQIPLKLAYALSIHKAQGMTIDLLDVNLASVFEYGQVYVALSRGTALSRCRVTGFDARNVKAHPRVIAFYRKLYTGKFPITGAASAAPTSSGSSAGVAALAPSVDVPRVPLFARPAPGLGYTSGVRPVASRGPADPLAPLQHHSMTGTAATSARTPVFGHDNRLPVAGLPEPPKQQPLAALSRMIPVPPRACATGGAACAASSVPFAPAPFVAPGSGPRVLPTSHAGCNADFLELDV